eukprot:639874-Pleurochrysis_carterae.AAC.2
MWLRAASTSSRAYACALTALHSSSTFCAIQTYHVDATQCKQTHHANRACALAGGRTYARPSLHLLRCAHCGRHQYGAPLRPWRYERAA